MVKIKMGKGQWCKKNKNKKNGEKGKKREKVNFLYCFLLKALIKKKKIK